MSFGITLYGREPEELLSVARRAEELGFDSLWLGEHIVIPEGAELSTRYKSGWSRPPLESGGDSRIYDTWVMVGCLLAGTRRIAVNTGVYLLPLRHPLITARACITAQTISGCRFGLAVGSGWLESEFHALGIPFEERGRRCDEILELLPRLFAGGEVVHSGKFYSFPELAMTRNSISIPILVGGSKDRALRRAARNDGWYGANHTLDECIAIREKIQRYRAETALRERQFRYYVRPVGTDIGQAVERWRADGFDDLVIPWDSIHPATSKDLSLDAALFALEEMARKIHLV